MSCRRHATIAIATFALLLLRTLLQGESFALTLKVGNDDTVIMPSPKQHVQEFESRQSKKSIEYLSTSTKKYPSTISVITSGCSGSNALMKFLHNVLNAHGLSIATHVSIGSPGIEILNPKNNKYWDSALQKIILQGGVPDINPKPSKIDPYFNRVMLEAMNQTILSVAENNQTLLFKSKSPSILTFHNCSLAKDLKEMGVRFEFLYRSNALDWAVCMVRDCFGDRTRGYPVFATNGTETNLCMARRTSAVKVKAHLDLSNLVGAMHGVENRLSRNMKTLLEFTESGEAFSNEELFAYEYTSDEDIFAKSLDAWTKFLSFAIDVDKSILTKSMRMHQDTLQLKPHADVIENIDEVTAVLRDTGLDHYMRF